MASLSLCHLAPIRCFTRDSDRSRRRPSSAATPKRDPSVEELPLIDFSSGYVTRALGHLPKQGATVPWRLYQNYALDLVTLQHGRVDDAAMQFS